MNKLVCFFVSFVILLATSSLWFSHKGEIILKTDLSDKSEITLQYRKKVNSNVIELKKKKINNDEVQFSTKGSSVAWFKINTPENINIEQVRFHGLRKANLTLNGKNEYKGKVLKNGIKIDWYKFFVLGALGWYLGWFLLYCFKNGIPQDDPKLPKMLNIEFLRVVFTLVIIYFHLVPKFGIWNNGRLGVEFFFILSGFLLVLTFRPDKTVGSFILSKWIRFMPLIVFGGLISSLFVSNVVIQRFLEQLIFVADRFLFCSVQYNGPAWYIFVLFWVSLAYFYALKSFRKETVNFWVGVSSVCATAYVLVYNHAVHGFISGNVVRGFACMGMGYFLAEVYQNLKEKKIIHQKAYNCFELGILLFAVLNLLYKPLYQGRLVSCMAFFVVILLFVLKKGMVSQFFEKPIFAKMARYCLAIYLTHRIVAMSTFPIYFDKYKEFFLQYQCLTIIGGMTLAVLLGVVAHHAVEIPATRALKKWLC